MHVIGEWQFGRPLPELFLSFNFCAIIPLSREKPKHSERRDCFMLELLLALVSCLSLAIASIVVIALSWKSRERIVSLEIRNFKVLFDKSDGKRN